MPWVALIEEVRIEVEEWEEPLHPDPLGELVSH
jgi:hypothetical protein